MTSTAQASRFGLIPLADRILWSSGLRAGVVVACISLWVGLPQARTASTTFDVIAVTAFSVVAVLVALSPRIGRRTSIGAVNTALVVDGVFLGAALHGLGGLNGMVSTLIVVHVTAVSLLTSFRSGVKVAAWNSIVVLCVLQAERVQRLNDSAPGTTPPDFPVRSYSVFVILVWVAALATSVFASLNERELRRRRYDAEVLHDLAAALERSADPDGIARTLARTMTEELLAHRAVVVIRPRAAVRDAIWTLVVASAPAADAPPGEPPHQFDPQSIFTRSSRTGEPVLAGALDPAADSWLRTLLPAARGVVCMALPLDAGAKGWVILELGATRGGVERRLLSTALQAASHAGLALTRAGLVEQLRRAAQTDGLTGAANRRNFDETLEREIARASRSRRPVAVAMVDLDHFKAINDVHGHQVGDEALQQAAHALQGTVRVGDLVARYGGEEFAVIFPDTNTQAGMEAAERLRIAVMDSGGPVAVTASVGIAVYAGDYGGLPGEAHALVAAADRALYAAKAKGRNRVEAATSVPAPRSPQPAPEHRLM